MSNTVVNLTTCTYSYALASLSSQHSQYVCHDLTSLSSNPERFLDTLAHDLCKCKILYRQE
jgi:hypothetical protein